MTTSKQKPVQSYARDKATKMIHWGFLLVLSVILPGCVEPTCPVTGAYWSTNATTTGTTILAFDNDKTITIIFLQGEDAEPLVELVRRILWQHQDNLEVSDVELATIKLILSQTQSYWITGSYSIIECTDIVISNAKIEGYYTVPRPSFSSDTFILSGLSWSPDQLLITYDGTRHVFQKMNLRLDTASQLLDNQYSLRCVESYNAGSFELAAIYCSRALLSYPINHPGTARYYSMRADSYKTFNNRYFDYAIADFLRVIKITPQALDNYGKLGDIYVLQGNCEQAKAAYQKGLERAKGSSNSEFLQYYQQQLESLEGLGGGTATANTTANLRAAPSLDAEIIGQVQQGQELRLVGQNESGDWYLLDSPNSNTWIYALLVNIANSHRC